MKEAGQPTQRIETLLDALDTLYLLDHAKGLITISELQAATRKLIEDSHASLEEENKRLSKQLEEKDREIARLRKSLQDWLQWAGLTPTENE